MSDAIVSLSDQDREFLGEISNGIHRIVDKIEETDNKFQRPFETNSERLNRELGISVGAHRETVVDSEL